MLLLKNLHLILILRKNIPTYFSKKLLSIVKLSQMIYTRAILHSYFKEKKLFLLKIAEYLTKAQTQFFFENMTNIVSLFNHKIHYECGTVLNFDSP